MGIRFKTLGVVLSILIASLPIGLQAEQMPRVLITEVKTGGVVDGRPTEYVELFNDSGQLITLTGWILEYAKPAAQITDCQSGKWKLQDSSASVKELALTGQINAGQRIVVELSMNDNVGGSLRLSNADVVYDTVGWGNSISQGVCKESELAPLPVNAKSIRRYIANDGQVVDTNNNKADFTDADSNLLPEPVLDSEPHFNDCVGIYLSEILPNPAGSDTGVEYVELYNSSSQTQDLTMCKIQVGSTVKQLSGAMQPGYQVFYGIVLPNADGGSVELITSTTEEVVVYPANLKDDQAWALINGTWQLTEQPTPGSQNISYLVVEEAEVSTTSELEPCPAGKYRNPETNRCKTIETDTGLKPCDPGQIRNPETNRCKSTTEALASLKPCEPGQERNPATNRCRKVAAEAVLAACKEGQERNPETNRCRKVAGASTSSPSSTLEQDIQSKQNIRYGIFAAMAVLVLGYGIYEYRSNIANFFTRTKK